MVEGVNTSLVRLVWEFGVLNAGESINQITIERGRPGSSARTLLASKSGEDAFTIQPGIEANKYKARLPLTLELLNVNNNEEFIYFVALSIKLSNKALEISPSQAQIDVKGK